MPNWCSNHLIVSGDAKELKRFKLVNIESYGTGNWLKLGNLFPMPEGENDWKSWRFDNWGTKWECECYHIEMTKDRLDIGFSSAWTPPTGWLLKIAPMFPTLMFTLTYQEDSAFFGGKMVVENDEYSEQVGDLTYEDEDGRAMEYDEEAGMYKYSDTGEMVDDEDFCPNYVNPFE